MVKILLLVLGLCLSQVWTAAVPPSSDNDLVQFLTRARALGADPNQFNYCFGYYTKELTEANDEYDLSYKSCIGSADNSLIAADNATAKDREEMFRRVDNACSFVRYCQPRECAEGVNCNRTVVDELDCISTTTKQSSSTLNDVAANAALTKDQLERSYQSIISDRDICTLKAHQEFNRRTDVIYDRWERCLKGEDWTTTTRQTTWPSSTDTPAPPAPSTTTYETTRREIYY